ncbi:MAG: YggS family pyridoxal phosphate-dependent enzyme [Bacteroidales bacterium]|nr:YggS family pyridoxal phosphate-dependent enzyme [Bacteroidales bacterium]
MYINSIKESVTEIRKSLPAGVVLVAAAKTRSPEEVQAAIDAGIKILGYNYLQEAERIYQIIGNKVQWHMIGHLQRNKVKIAVDLFDMIETIDSVKLAEEVNKRCAAISKIMPVLIEINSGKELNKTGVLPEDVDKLVKPISSLPNLRVQGLMTMGPRFGSPEDARQYFKATKLAFDRLSKAGIHNVEMRYLSMGMSNSYKVAIEEGANIVRVGTKLFGERSYPKY